MSFSQQDGNALLKSVFAPWIQDLSLSVISVGDVQAVLRMPFSDRLCREGGVLCGQSLMALADTSAVLAISAAGGGYRNMTTVDQSIHLMKPVSNQDALATATVVRLGRMMAFVRVDICAAEKGDDVAIAQLAYALLP